MPREKKSYPKPWIIHVDRNLSIEPLPGWKLINERRQQRLRGEKVEIKKTHIVTV